MIEHIQDELVFFGRPISSNDRRINDIVPSFPALAAEPAGQIARNYDPILGPILQHFLFEYIIFGFSPLSTTACLSLYCHGCLESFQLRWRPIILRWWIKWLVICVICWGVYFLLLVPLSFILLVLICLGGLPNLFKVKPSLEASYLGLIWHEFAKSVPRLVAIDVHKAT